MNTTAIDWMDVGLGWVTVLITLGIVFVAFRAFQEARRSADAAGRSADAANETAKIAGMEHDARMQPWIGMVRIECLDDTWPITIQDWQVTLKNFGIMPALDVQIRIAILCEGKPEVWRMKRAEMLGRLYPEHEKPYPFSFDAVTIGKIEQNAEQIRMHVEVFYRTKTEAFPEPEHWVYQFDGTDKKWLPYKE